MPRSSNSGKSRPSASRAIAPAPAPAPATYVPSHHRHTVEVERPGFFSNMWQGFGLGAGQSIAHNIFRKDPVVTHVHEPSTVGSSPDIKLPKEFVQCMKENQNDKELCKQFL